jgi:hypothetical protein
MESRDNPNMNTKPIETINSSKRGRNKNSALLEWKEEII